MFLVFGCPVFLSWCHTFCIYRKSNKWFLSFQNGCISRIKCTFLFSEYPTERTVSLAVQREPVCRLPDHARELALQPLRQAITPQGQKGPGKTHRQFCRHKKRMNVGLFGFDQKKCFESNIIVLSRCCVCDSAKKSNLRNQKTLNVYIQVLSDREHIDWGRSPSGPEPEQQLVSHYKKSRTNDLSNKASPYILRSFSN